MKLREILQDLQVLNMTADPETEIRGISYDSRKTEPGDLFVAIKGFEADGHRFIPKALEKGAAVILCEDAPGDDTPYVQIADCRYGLAVASANFFRHPAKEMKIVGFTGTSGKTSSTQVLKHVLESELGAKVGLTFENKGMDMDARVKNYHMEIVKGGEVLAGMFTGNVVTRVTQWMFTVPLQVTCDVGKVRLRCGPYFSYLTGSTFDGWAYDGHLRVDDPTGAKVMLGHDEGERGEYDFSDSMRRLQIGMGIGADWYFMRKFGVWADLNMGFHGVHKSDFRTIEQTLYPIYGAVGITYKIR